MLGRKDKDTITVKDVPAELFINALAAHLKDTNKIELPNNVDLIKTGVGRQLSPYDKDWFYVRVAAVARKIYLRPHLGVGTMQHIFGTKQNFGYAKYHHSKGSGKIIRLSLAQLEKLEYLEKDSNRELKKNSRIVSSKGRKELNNIAKKVFNQLLEEKA